MTVLVVGYGSIGARHARLFREKGYRTVVVSKRNVEFPIVFNKLENALAAEKPCYVIIATSTALHYETFERLARAGYNGTVLVEKPVFHSVLTLPDHNFRDAFVAYNLRFHPAVIELRSLLEGQTIISAQAYVGQYLPDWRPAIDYRQSYSAQHSLGGGALRDLSHELDYLTWLFGGWLRVAAIGGHLSDLNITSDDVFALLIVTPACPVVTVQMNYLDRCTRRELLINTSKHTIALDLLKGTVMIDRSSKAFPVTRDFTYNSMHDALLTDKTYLCTISEGLEVMRLVEAAELAAVRGEWVSR